MPIRALVLVFCCVLIMRPLSAQCTPQGQATELRREAVRLLAGPDPDSTRWIFDLPEVDSSRIQVVTQPLLCRRAADLYVKYEPLPEDSTGKPLAATYAVVRADSL